MIMKKLVFLWIACSFGASTWANAANEETLRPILEERYAAMKSAMAKRDGDAFSSLLAANFLSVDVSGQQENAAQIIAELKQLPPDNMRTAKTTLRSIKVEGGTARVEQVYDMKTKKTAADGKLQDIELVTVSEDIWILSKGVWLCESTTTNQLDYTVNGQAVAHRTRQE
jgi:hypothetical protein